MTTIDHGRRRLCGCLGGGALALGLGLGGPAPRALAAADPGARTAMSPDQALATLREGNELFVADRPAAVQRTAQRRLAIAQAQHPFAVLVGCSDSRVSPELLFGRGLGDLFIIRNAGNTVDTSAQGSVEYAVAELGVPLIVVLGHTRCGAVGAALEVAERDAAFPGVINRMVEPIVPSVLAARRQMGEGQVDEGALLDACVRENARRVANDLRASYAVMTEQVEAGRLKVVAAYYDLDDGRVDFFEGV